VCHRDLKVSFVIQHFSLSLSFWLLGLADTLRAKLENLLLDNEGNLKITDFGHAGIFPKGWDIFSTSLVGSLWHLAPEQLAGSAYSGEKYSSLALLYDTTYGSSATALTNSCRVDVWATGVVLFRMLAGRPPFSSENPQEFVEQLRAARYAVPEHLSPGRQKRVKHIRYRHVCIAGPEAQQRRRTCWRRYFRWTRRSGPVRTRCGSTPGSAARASLPTSPANPYLSL
jgi:serine/threonine protein kinase